MICRSSWNRPMHRRYALTLISAALAMTHAHADDYPSRPLRIIVPFPPGGTTDAVSRLVAQQMAQSLGQPVIVENKAGAGTLIGVDAGAKALPDGYTLTCVSASFTINHTLVKKLPYDTFKDFRPVTFMGLSEHVLVVHPSVKARNVRELIALSRTQRLSFGSFGNGSAPHMAGEQLRSMTGMDLVHVPYKGQGPALNDLLGGQIPMMFGNWPDMRSHIATGKLAVIGMATAKRSVFAPEIPTLAEQGAAIESASWNGLVLPAATPDAIVLRLNAEVRKAMAVPAVKEALARAGTVALVSTPEQFGEFMHADAAKYAKLIQAAKITLDN
jgi:tripartite-type tricarboxylate transporter receptor subunit TctC